MDIQALIKPAIERLNRWRFQHALSGVLGTNSLVAGQENFILLSMVHKRDIQPYLLAVKSFAQYLLPKQIVVVADPSIDDADRAILKHHISNLRLIDAIDLREDGIPTGGCWERLTAIADLVNNDYVIQLDADTVCINAIPEVVEAIRSGASFVLGTEDGQVLSSVGEAACWARERLDGADHPQSYAESFLDCLAEPKWKHYVRGCAGFSGFSKGSFIRDDLKYLSKVMHEKLGDRWKSWGTEQFASNLMVSNSPKAVVLPHPKYCHPGRETEETVFLHFVGYVRYRTGRYAEVARLIINRLNAQSK